MIDGTDSAQPAGDTLKRQRIHLGGDKVETHISLIFKASNLFSF